MPIDCSKSSTVTDLSLNYTITWRRQWHPTPLLLPGKSYGWRSPVGSSPWGLKEWDMTEWLTLSVSERGGADDMHLHFPGGRTNPDRVRELSRITELIRPPWITHGSCSGWWEGEGSGEGLVSQSGGHDVRREISLWAPLETSNTVVGWFSYVGGEEEKGRGTAQTWNLILSQKPY